MNWLRLTPDSIGVFLLLLLALIALAYLFKLKNKTKQTKSLIVYFLILNGVLITSFIQRTGPSQWQSWLFLQQLILTMTMFTALYYFSRIFLNTTIINKTPKAVILTTTLMALLLLILAVGEQPANQPGYFIKVFVVYLLVLTIMPTWSFCKRSIEASKKSIKKTDKLDRDKPHKAKAIKQLMLLINPVGTTAFGLRNYTLLSLLPLLLIVNGVLTNFYFVSIAWRDTIILVVGATYIFGFVVIYISYAEERSSVNAKLVGLSLVMALLVLEIITSTLYTPAKLSTEAGITAIKQQTIRFKFNDTGGYQVDHDPNINNQIQGSEKWLEVPGHGKIDLTFDFPFYLQEWNSLTVKDSGIIIFSDELNKTKYYPFRGAQGFDDDNSVNPRIMPLNLGFKRDIEGTIRYLSQPDLIIIRWTNISQRLSNTRSSFSVKLFSNGNVEFDYLNIQAELDEGIIGISPGIKTSTVVPLNIFNFSQFISPKGSAILENLSENYRHHAHQQLLTLVYLILFTAVFILLVFPYFYNIVLSKPLKQLLDGLQLVDKGSLDTEIEIYSSDEFGALALHFNRMTASLRRDEEALQHNAMVLENKVLQRTKELDEQNLILENQWQQLMELDEAKSRLFANLSHEFRTPLTLTLGSLQDLHSGQYGQQSVDAISQIDSAMRNSRQVLLLINQMLDIAKIEGDHFALRIVHIDITAIMEQLGQAFVPLAERKNINFDIDLPKQPRLIDCDPDQFEKIVTNLLSNAFKFTPDQGTVRLALQFTDESLSISVRDSGTGIHTDKLAHVFERFYQVEDHGSGLQTGSGIGLALVKELVELHLGHITVKSEFGFGSTFIVTIPRFHHKKLNHTRESSFPAPKPILEATSLYSLQTSAVNKATKASEMIVKRTKQQVLDLVEDCTIHAEQVVQHDVANDDRTTILVVDDNAEIRAYIHRHLIKKYRVVEAVDGYMALNLLPSLLPDLIISDVMMPKMDGAKLCEAMRKDPKINFIPIILLTAKASEQEKLKGLQLGADDYLAKPFNMKELLIRVENLIQSNRRIQTHYSRPVQLDVNPVKVDSSDQKFLQRLQTVIEDHLDDPEFSVEILASKVGQSRSNLHRKLKIIMNQTPTDVIRNIRLQRSVDLLEQRTGTISEIAYSVGFKAVAHFSTSFKNKYGVPPSSYLN